MEKLIEMMIRGWVYVERLVNGEKILTKNRGMGVD